jgi:hypothetical protein
MKVFSSSSSTTFIAPDRNLSDEPEKRPLLRFPGIDGFEEGWDGWFTDMGVWEVGAPTSGPEVAHSGTNCAGTVLGGNYPYETDSRLISPVIDVPAVGANEEVVLAFW